MASRSLSSQNLNYGSNLGGKVQRFNSAAKQIVTPKAF